MNGFWRTLGGLGFLSALLFLGIFVVLFVLPGTSIVPNCRPPRCTVTDLLPLALLLIAAGLSGIWAWIRAFRSRIPPDRGLLVLALFVMLVSVWNLSRGADDIVSVPWISWLALILNGLYALTFFAYRRAKAPSTP